MANDKKYKIVYCTPALYMAGGVERVLTLKANYFAEQFGYDITIILTEGRDKPLFYPLSEKVRVVNLDINFEELWTCSFLKKIIVYLRKQWRFKKLLTSELMSIRPDITVSLLRREINFITAIKDGSKKIGEIHVNKSNYRNFEKKDSNFLKSLFAKFWMQSLQKHLRSLDRFVVLTEEDCLAWTELSNVVVIPDPLTFFPKKCSTLTNKRIIAVGRYTYQKGFDLLLRAWGLIEKECPDWSLAIYGQGDRQFYNDLVTNLGLDRNRCQLNSSVVDIQGEFVNSSLFAFSSRFEGFGMVLIEAMACGLPVVSFDCPCGPKDIIQNEIDGLLVQNGNVGKLAESMLLLIKDRQRCITMSENARQNVQRYEIRNIANKWRSLFDSLFDEF